MLFMVNESTGIDADASKGKTSVSPSTADWTPRGETHLQS